MHDEFPKEFVSVWSHLLLFLVQYCVYSVEYTVLLLVDEAFFENHLHCIDYLIDVHLPIAPCLEKAPCSKVIHQ